MLKEFYKAPKYHNVLNQKFLLHYSNLWETNFGFILHVNIFHKDLLYSFGTHQLYLNYLEDERELHLKDVHVAFAINMLP